MANLTWLKTAYDGPVDTTLAPIARPLRGNTLYLGAKRCLDAGMDDYLAKPIRAEQLLQTIEAVVDESRSPDRD